LEQWNGSHASQLVDAPVEMQGKDFCQSVTTARFG